MSTQRFRRACLAGLGAVALGAGMLGSSAGTAQAGAVVGSQGALGAACIAGTTVGMSARSASGEYHRGGPSELTNRQVRRMERRTEQAVAARPGLEAAAARQARTARNIVIPVAVHTIKPRKSARNEVGRQKAREAVRIMNRGFAGKQADNAFDTSFEFRLVSYDVAVNKSWYDTGFGTRAELRMKRALKVGGKRTLNVYYNKPEEGLLGWAYLPQSAAADTKLDGVVINIESNKGGEAAPYNRGDTLTHEVGHWLGLYHTFQGGCSHLNDRVSDTAPQAFPNLQCPRGLDTCTDDNRRDPIHNFMDYSFDRCMYKFTRGQNNRMVLHWLAHRK